MICDLGHDEAGNGILRVAESEFNPTDQWSKIEENGHTGMLRQAKGNETYAIWVVRSDSFVASDRLFLSELKVNPATERREAPMPEIKGGGR